MLLRFKVLMAASAVLAGGVLWAQSPEPGSEVRQPGRGDARAPRGEEDRGEARRGTAAIPTASGGAIRGGDLLGRSAGQTWQAYDLTPYTQRIDNTQRPEQTVVDWILRETGYEAWHAEPMGVLSADNRTLKVYHTPQMQAVVGGVVERFVSRENENHAFGLRIVTMSDPNWRLLAHRVLRPLPVQTPGVQAWMLEREEASLLIAELQKRSDYLEHSTSQLQVHNGQTHVVTRLRPKIFQQNVLLQPTQFPPFQAVSGQVDEGLALEFSPLLSRDGALVDAVVKCYIDQVETLRTISVDVPSAVGARQKANIEVPQIVQFRLQERFRWPTDKVLLIGLGMTPAPLGGETTSFFLGPPTPARADLLLMIESKGKHAPARGERVGGRPQYHGRY